VAGAIGTNKKSNDLIGNQTSDLPACSIVAQPTTSRVEWQYDQRTTGHVECCKQAVMALLSDTIPEPACNS
jgi:hypothetical protein